MSDFRYEALYLLINASRSARVAQGSSAITSPFAGFLTGRVMRPLEPNLTPTVGISLADGPSSTAGELPARFLRLRTDPRHSARISSTADSASSVRRSL